MIDMPDDTDLGPLLFCLPCETTWRHRAGDRCWSCGQPGVPGRIGNSAPEGWPRTTALPAAVTPG